MIRSHRTITGKVTNSDTPETSAGLDVILYKDRKLLSDELLGYTATNGSGEFVINPKKKLRDSSSLYILVQSKGLDLAKIESVNFDAPNELTVNNDNIRKLVNTTRAEGWKGGFEESNPAFKYPKPDLNPLPMFDNLANIDLLTRQQKVIWPEFSWQAIKGNEDSRCYQMFAPDISRLGYTDEGRVYSIICPQQGAASVLLGSISVEVTVTGNKGWVNEETKELAADMRVTGKIWFAPNQKLAPFTRLLISRLKRRVKPSFEHAFPFSKADAIHIKTFLPGNPDQPIFPLRVGLSDRFSPPAFSQHYDLAWNYANLDVQIGSIWKTGDKVVDDFNQTILDIFNLAKKNILQEGNILTWNIWFTAPEKVDQKEWGQHAEKWRRSIDADHGSPNGNGSIVRTAEESAPTTRGIKKDVKQEDDALLMGKEKAMIHELIERHLDGDEAQEIKEEMEKQEAN